MQKATYIIFLLLIKLYFSPSAVQAENLVFHHGKFVNEWTIDPTNLDFYSSIYLDKDSSLCLATRGNPLRMEYVALSRHRATDSKISISIRYKTQYCNKINLIIARNNGAHTVSKTDTIKLKPSLVWTLEKQYIKLHDPQLLNISIEVQRIEGRCGKLWISDISIPNETLTNVDSAQIDSSFLSLKSNIKCWSDSDWNQFPFMKKNILGIGETCHGTQEMQDIAISIMKERILKNNCRLICWEWPLERGLYIDRFIHGDSNFHLENISKEVDSSLCSSSFLSFLEWLKHYNSIHCGKVSFCGIDFEPIRVQALSDLYNFFECLNKGRNVSGIDSICQSLSFPEISTKEIANQISHNKVLDAFLNTQEKKIINQSLKLADYNYDTLKRLTHRDQAFYNNFLIEGDSLIKLGQTATLYGHFAHLNYVDALITHSKPQEDFNAGCYIKNKYKDDYSCVGVIALKGTAIYLDTHNDSTMEVELRKTPQFSLESELSKLSADSLYLPTENMNTSFYSSCRIAGRNLSPTKGQFIFPIAPKLRADGFIYLRQVHAMKKEKAKNSINSELNKYMKLHNNKK